MSTLKNTLITAGFADHVFTDSDLNHLLAGTPAARYGMVNKALQKKALIKVRRGLYLLAEVYRRQKLSKFYLASRIAPHSYISLESALSYHGWIPERVTTVTSIIAGNRIKKFTTPFGEFTFHPLPINEYEFLTHVTRAEDIKHEPFLLASPLRALADYVYIKKISWTSLTFLTDGLRIDIKQLLGINDNQFFALKKVYRSKRVLHFLDRLQKELKK